MADIIVRCFINYCKKHSIAIELQSRVQSGWWIFKKEIIVFVMTGQQQALNTAHRQFRKALWA